MPGLLLATLLRSVFSNSSQSRRTVAMSNCCRCWSKIRRFWKFSELLNGKRQIFVYFGHLWSFWINLRGQLRYSNISIIFWQFSFDFSDIFRALFDPLLTTLWQQKKSVCCLKATLWFWSEHELKACAKATIGNTTYLAVAKSLHSRFWNNLSSSGSLNEIFCQWIDQTWNKLLMKFHEIQFWTAGSEHVLPSWI